MQHLRACLLVLPIISTLALPCGSQVPKEGQNKAVELIGIVLASDHKCSGNPSTDLLCRLSDFALASGRTTYLLYGNQAALQKFARQRVKISGTFEEESVVIYGSHERRRKIVVQSIEPDELSEQEIESYVQRLSVVPWPGPENHCSPMCWDFSLTDPMRNILQAGISAQDILLLHINDEKVQDQIVMLLGGVGDEKAIAPIIGTMIDAKQAAFDDRAKRLNLVANIALTNLTVSEVIWHHGGGVPHDRCPDDPKRCWSNWWNDNKASFRVGVGGDRLYVNYPNYGIYAQFDDVSPF